MYNWRKMTPKQRENVLHIRKQCGHPWHCPPNGLEKHWIHISAACYEHRPTIGMTPERLAAFERDLLTTIAPVSETIGAWCVLPNHYHVLAQSINQPAIRRALGLLHGRTSCAWNREDDTKGRTCWHSGLFKEVKSDAHRWATLNYIHHNPVHHEYVTRWQDWPFSSANQYLEQVGHSFAEKIWNEFPLLDYGKGWDE